MARKYEKVQELLSEIQQLLAEGYTQQEVANRLGLSNKEVVSNLLHRERHTLQSENRIESDE